MKDNYTQQEVDNMLEDAKRESFKQGYEQGVKKEFFKPW